MVWLWRKRVLMVWLERLWERSVMVLMEKENFMMREMLVMETFCRVSTSFSSLYPQSHLCQNVWIDQGQHSLLYGMYQMTHHHEYIVL